MLKKVSIIVPIYNLEKVLPKCINSLKNQTYNTIEIILVNDGSTDASLKICEKYASLDKRIQVIDKKNAGVELARKAGFDNAAGDYIVFVDGDDWLPANAVETMLVKAENTKADIVIGSMTRVMDRFAFISRKSILDKMEIQNEELMKKYYISFFGVNILPVNMWGKMYRKELLDKHTFPITGLKHGEDLCFNMCVFPYAEKIVTISQSVYFYRWGGMTSKMNYGLFEEARMAYRLKMEMLQKFFVKDGKRFTAIELKNFLLTYAESFIIHTKLTLQEISPYILEAMHSEEMQDALKHMTEKDLENEKTQAIAQGNADKLLQMLYPQAVKKRRKRKVMSLASKILVS